MPKLMTLEGFLGCPGGLGDDLDDGMTCENGVCRQYITLHPVEVPIGVMDAPSGVHVPDYSSGSADLPASPVVESAPAKKNFLPWILAGVAVYLAVK